MKKLAVVLFCVSLCITIAFLYPRVGTTNPAVDDTGCLVSGCHTIEALHIHNDLDIGCDSCHLTAEGEGEVASSTCLTCHPAEDSELCDLANAHPEAGCLATGCHAACEEPLQCSVGITPSTATVFTWESVQLSATVDGLCNEPFFTWEISSGGCTGNATGSAIGGTIDANGLYTAGDMQGTDIVRVIDGNNADICATAEITVTTPPPTTIIICNCDTGVMDVEIEDGLTMSDLIEECAFGAKNRGVFVSCVSKLTNKWKKDGLINGREKGAIQSCATRFKPVETVDYVDVERYTGLWYQIASYFNPNIGNLAGVTAEYTINQDGTVKVVNKGFVGGLAGTPVMIEGVARVVDETTNAKLAVSFPEFGITEESEYWIIELGEYYSYAVVTNSQRSSLFILNRRPTMEESVYQDIIDRLAMQCFDPEQIIKTPQFDEMPPPETVGFVDIERYMGLWYEIARYPVPFDEDGVAVTAEYTLNEDGTVSLINRSLVGDLDGPPNSIEGTARVVDEETKAKLAVTFDRPELEGIEFPYWIIELDEDYQWAVVSNDTRFVLYILNRTSTMDDDVYEDILYRVVKKGFDADKLELTPQPEEQNQNGSKETGGKKKKEGGKSAVEKDFDTDRQVPGHQPDKKSQNGSKETGSKKNKEGGKSKVR